MSTMTTATISDTFTGPTTVVGRVLFTPDTTGVFTSGGIEVAERYVAVLDGTGHFSIDLPANDTGNPTGWTWSVTEDFRGGRFYHISAPTGAWTLRSLAPVPSSAGEAIVQGPQGPAGPAGGAIAPVHQTVAAATWTIVHNLGIKPAVALFADDDPTHQTYTDVSYPDLNTVVISWPAPETGWVYFG